MSYNLDWLENEKLEKKESQEEKITPEPEKKIEKFTSRAEAIDPLPIVQKPKKLKIGVAELNLLSKSLKKTSGSDISNVHISQDDLWLLYRLKFGKGTRAKRSVLLPKFTEAFNRNLKLKKK